MAFFKSFELSNSLYSMGAHIGHLHVEAYDSMSYYLLGTRHFFVIFDLYKTIPLLKNALVFFENLVSNFGNALFCYSGISILNIHIRFFFSRLISERNQSFSYWRWSPGCLTNYRSVFLRLVSYLYGDYRRVFSKSENRCFFHSRITHNRNSLLHSFFLRNRFLIQSDLFELYSGGDSLINFLLLNWLSNTRKFLRFKPHRRRNNRHNRRKRYIRSKSKYLKMPIIERRSLKKGNINNNFSSRTHDYSFSSILSNNFFSSILNRFRIIRLRRSRFLFNNMSIEKRVYRYTKHLIKLLRFYRLKNVKGSIKFNKLKKMFLFIRRYKPHKLSRITKMFPFIKKYKFKHFFFFRHFYQLLKLYYHKNNFKSLDAFRSKKKIILFLLHKLLNMERGHKIHKSFLIRKFTYSFSFFKCCSYFYNKSFQFFIFHNSKKFSFFRTYFFIKRYFYLLHNNYVTGFSNSSFISKYKKKINKYWKHRFYKNKRLFYYKNKRMYYYKKYYNKKIRMNYKRSGYNKNKRIPSHIFRKLPTSYIHKRYYGSIDTAPLSSNKKHIINKHDNSISSCKAIYGALWRKKRFLYILRTMPFRAFRQHYRLNYKIHKRYKKSNVFRKLPSFVSLIIRLFYITKNRFHSFFTDQLNINIDENVYFNSLYSRFLLFWRAIIFFRFFKKTVSAPDCLVFLNPDNQLGPFNDFSGLNIPVISISDSNSYLSRITYFIPSNDDSLILLLFYFLLFLNACDSGMSIRYSSLY